MRNLSSFLAMMMVGVAMLMVGCESPPPDDAGGTATPPETTEQTDEQAVATPRPTPLPETEEAVNERAGDRGDREVRDGERTDEGRRRRAQRGEQEERPRPPATTIVDDQMKFSFPDLEGNIVTDEDEKFKGKVLVVDVWGSWCPPCRVELPYLVEFYEKYREQGLEIVGLAFEQGEEEEQVPNLKKFVEENGIKYTVLHCGSRPDAGATLTAVENFSGFPTTIFIGRDGLVKKVDVGFSDARAPEMEEFIKELLAK